MSKNKLPYYKEDSSIPLIRFFLSNGEEAIGLCDSGADSTVFSKSLVDKYPDCFCEDSVVRNMSFADFTGGNKSMEIQEKYLCVSFKKDSDQIKLKGLVYDLSHITRHFGGLEVSALFGTDTLDKIGAVIDFKNKNVKVDDISCQ